MMVEFMGKVLVTREQLDRITDMVEVVGREMILKAHKDGWEHGNNLCLNELSYEEMEKILDNRTVCLVATPEVIAFQKLGEEMNDWKSEMQSMASEYFERKLNDLIEDGEKIPKNMQANGYTEKEQEHLNSPFYKKVDEITEKVKMQQILKGAEKYPEPFNPASWTGEQLVNHGLQEARDLQVYLVGLAEHIARIEAENKALKDYEKEYKWTIERLEKENDSLKEELKQWKLAHG